MNLIIKIAWRNVWRHKGKSFVVGFIIFIGALLMTIGNGMISGMEKGLKRNISESFTGDIVISSRREPSDDVLLRQMGTPLEVIRDFDDLKNILDKDDYIADYLPITFGFGTVLNIGMDMNFIGLIGVDIERYMEFFPNNMEIIEGRQLKANERGVIIASHSREELFLASDYWTIPSGEELNKDNLSEEAKLYEEIDLIDELIIMGLSKNNTALDVRVPIRGVLRFNSLNKFWGNFSLIDIDSYREANNMITGQVEVTLNPKELAFFESDFFFEDDFIGDIQQDISSLSFEEFNIDMKDTISILSSEEIQRETDTGAYQVVLVRLKNINEQMAINHFNNIFEENNIDAKAISWQKSIGILGNMATFYRLALNLFIMFIFFVAIIVIMNTLSMAAMERISELGMMRAIGAKKLFLKSMFVTETGFLSLFFGGLGIIFGIFILLFIKSLELETTNEFLQLIYGGDILDPVVSLKDLILGVVQLTVVSILAVLYPVRLVSKIKPLDAIAVD